jgi:hypothetical protein
VPGTTARPPGQLDGGAGRDWFLFDPKLGQVADRAKNQRT